MPENKIDFIYKYLKEREKVLERHKRQEKIFCKVVLAIVYFAVLLIILYVAAQLLNGSIATFGLIKSDDIKLAVESLVIFIIGLGMLWFAMFGLPNFYPFNEEKKDAR